MDLIEFRDANIGIGLASRNGTDGPEAELVSAFRQYVPDCFRWRAGNVAVFHEPRVETGFPDLVVVQYSPEAIVEWSPARSELTPADLKIMHHLASVGGETSTSLIGSLGVGARALLASLERLVDANMVVRASRTWKTRPMKSVFALQSVVAVEAKVRNWNGAFRQAHLDRWFASETYVLSPAEEPRPDVMGRSEQTGVGVLLLNGNKVRRFRPSEKRRLPASYGSWLFNEWIGRHLHGGQ